MPHLIKTIFFGAFELNATKMLMFILKTLLRGRHDDGEIEDCQTACMHAVERIWFSILKCAKDRNNNSSNFFFVPLKTTTTTSKNNNSKMVANLREIFTWSVCWFDCDLGIRSIEWIQLFLYRENRVTAQSACRQNAQHTECLSSFWNSINHNNPFHHSMDGEKTPFHLIESVAIIICICKLCFTRKSQQQSEKYVSLFGEWTKYSCCHSFPWLFCYSKQQQIEYILMSMRAHR